jgi:hypothetical protein
MALFRLSESDWLMERERESGVGSGDIVKAWPRR